MDGGAVQTICETGSGLGGAWSTEGQIVFAPRFGSGLFVVPASGGVPVPATSLDAARGDAAHLFPTFLPDGRHFVFVARNLDPEKTAIALGDLDSKASRPLFHADSFAVWAEPDSLLFAREGALMAQRFDAKSLASVGDPVPIVPNVRFMSDNNNALLSAGRGALLYGLWTHERRLVWVDRTGREVGTVGAVADYDDLSLSPDGRRVAASIRDPGRGLNLDIWVVDTERGSASRVTSERTDEFHPVWLPGGKTLAYMSDHVGFYDLYRRSAEGGAEEVVLKTAWDKVLGDLTRDGLRLLFSGAAGGSGDDLWTVALSGPAEPERVTSTPRFDELVPGPRRTGAGSPSFRTSPVTTRSTCSLIRAARSGWFRRAAGIRRSGGATARNCSTSRSTGGSTPCP